MLLYIYILKQRYLLLCKR